MTVGLSENFVGTGEPTRRVFNYDTAGGSADISDGNAEIEKMYGDTVAWNQLCPHSYPSGTDGGITYTNNGDGSYTLNGTCTQTSYLWFVNTYTVPDIIKPNHKYLCTTGRKSSDVDVVFQFILYDGFVVQGADSKIASTPSSLDSYSKFAYVVRFWAGSTYDNAVIEPMLIDLTQMFGSTIADHIYSLEQSQAGAGVAWFKKLFPLDYYPYNAGTLLNVNPAGIKTVGFNAYDKATGKAELIGGNQYQITGTYTSLSYSTGEVLTPDSTGCFTPTKTGELTVTGGGENTCVHLTWSGYRNGDYEDYWTRTRDINIQPYFPDGLKRAGTVYDEISKDKAVKRIGVVDLGSLTWETDVSNRFRAQLSGIKNPTTASERQDGLVCARYSPSSSPSLTDMTDKSMLKYSGEIFIKDTAYTDAQTFKTAMSGVMLYYELDTPIETKIDPSLNLLYQVSDFGTEQFLGAGATEPKTLPIIADIVYGVNYRDTIKNLPKNYAKVRGYYPDLYTGLADNLIDRKGNGTPQEISYRTSCGDDSITDDGNGIIQSIFGKTVVWNQLVKNGQFNTISGWTIDGDNQSYSINEGVCTIELSSQFTSSGLSQSKSYRIGHKYLGLADVRPNGASFKIAIGQPYLFREMSCTDGVFTKLSYVWSPTENTGNSAFFQIGTKYADGVVRNISITNPQLFDLTQMFGAGNEPSTLDDPRIKWIKDYANEYPEYNIGELISYNGSWIKTVGFNQWDEEWEVGSIGSTTGQNTTASNLIRAKNYIPVFPDTAYFMKTPVSAIVYYYDTNKNFIGLGLGGSDLSAYRFTTPSNCRFIRFRTAVGYGNTYNHDICINLSWSGYRNGEYEPYWNRTLNLPISTYFPDGMKSAGSVRDELTKDKVIKRIGFVDLGTLNWVTGDGYGYTYMTNPTNPKRGGNILAIMPPTITNYAINTENDALVVYYPAGSYSDGIALKSAMSGHYAVYELAEPIETTITPPLDLTYKVADFGTEESIAEGKSTPFNGIIKYSDDFTRGLVNMPKNYDTTASLDALAASLSAMLTSALDGTVTITRGAYDPATKKYEWDCQFTKNQVN